MKPVYELNVEVDGKPVQFTIQADDSLKVQRQIPDNVANKMRNRLCAVAYAVFKKEKLNDNR